MARKTFFSFHYERDCWRAGQVRNCNMLPTEDQHGFIDDVDWESIKREGDDAIERWIDRQLEGTTVTVVLIGTGTADRDWVLEEIEKSWNRGNGLVGVWIHNVRDKNSTTDTKGANPFDKFELGDGTRLSAVCKVYDWVDDDGRNNLGSWSEDAVTIRDKYESDEDLKRCAAVKQASAGVLRNVGASQGFTPRAPWCGDDRNR